jgi:hypothetical protein
MTGIQHTCHGGHVSCHQRGIKVPVDSMAGHSARWPYDPLSWLCSSACLVSPSFVGFSAEVDLASLWVWEVGGQGILVLMTWTLISEC